MPYREHDNSQIVETLQRRVWELEEKAKRPPLGELVVDRMLRITMARVLGIPLSVFVVLFAIPIDAWFASLYYQSGRWVLMTIELVGVLSFTALVYTLVLHLCNVDPPPTWKKKE